MRVNEHIAYKPNEKPPLPVTLAVASQGTVLVVSGAIAFITAFWVASGAGQAYLLWMMFASLVIAGVATVQQSAKLRFVGPGYNSHYDPGSPFLAVCVLTIAKGGLAVMASLVVAATLVQFALAFWLARVRRIITPVVSGVALMLIAISVMDIAFARFDDVPADVSPIAAIAVGAVVLVTGVILMLRAIGSLRVFAISVTVAVGYAAAASLGMYDFQPAINAPWFGLPQLSAWPGFSSVLDEKFLAFLSVFLAVSVMVGIKASSEASVIQRFSWRKPRAVDFREIQETLNVCGVGMLLSGIAGILPVNSYLPSSVSIINFSGVAARRIGVFIGVMLVALALLPKFIAVLLTVPRPVASAVLLIGMTALYVEGIRTVLQDDLNRVRAFTVGVSLAVGIGMQQHNILAEILGVAWGLLFGYSVLAGILTALFMSLILELSRVGRKRFETELDNLGPGWTAGVPARNNVRAGLESGFD